MLQTGVYLKRPMRKITALSNSDTTLKHTNSENGNVASISMAENRAANISMHPGMLFWAVNYKQMNKEGE